MILKRLRHGQAAADHQDRPRWVRQISGVRTAAHSKSFQNTEVTFRKTYGIGDLLNVWMGKVKVYIQHLPGIPNPNNVTTPTALISVRGTIFDVDVQDVDGTTFVAVDEGHGRCAPPAWWLRASSACIPGESVQVHAQRAAGSAGARSKASSFRRCSKAAQDAARGVAYSVRAVRRRRHAPAAAWLHRRRTGRQGQEYRHHTYRHRHGHRRTHRRAARSAASATSSGGGGGGE